MKTHRYLRHERVAVQDCVAGHFELQAEHIHLHVLARLHAKGGNTIERDSRGGIKVLPRKRHFQTLGIAQSCTESGQGVVVGFGTRDVDRAANLTRCGVGADDRPRRQATPAAPSMELTPPVSSSLPVSAWARGPQRAAAANTKKDVVLFMGFLGRVVFAACLCSVVFAVLSVRTAQDSKFGLVASFCKSYDRAGAGRGPFTVA